MKNPNSARACQLSKYQQGHVKNMFEIYFPGKKDWHTRAADCSNMLDLAFLLRDISSHFFDEIDNLKEENERLDDENDALQAQVNQYDLKTLNQQSNLECFMQHGVNLPTAELEHRLTCKLNN